jgi:hypothetical protein
VFVKQRALPVVFLPVILLFLSLSWGQFMPDEIAARDALERFLADAEIVNSEPVGEGVTKPFKIFLEKDGEARKAIWKNPEGVLYSGRDSWKYEIAAYRLDRLLGLGMIPPTVERSFRDRRGSLQLWVDTPLSLLDVQNRGISIPESCRERTDRAKYLVRAFDSLIANEDRTQQNIRFTSDWRMILIDHSCSFRSSRKFTERLIFGSNGLSRGDDGRPYLFRRLPRAFPASLKSLTFDQIRETVGPYLTDEEIRAILARRDLLLAEIEEAIGKQGEGKVLYDP